LLISLAGCPGKAPDRTKNDAAGKVGRGDLPPLKIGILDCDELSEVLVNRWQEYSDQPIELIRFERLKVGTQDSPSLDVILYPGNFLGTLFEKEWIAPLPSLLLERLGGQKQNGDKRNTGKKSLTPKNLDSEDSPQGFESWSSRWRSIAHYNGKSVGLPLGAPCWVAATRGLDIEPLKRLHQAIASNQNNSELASESLEAFLQKSESTLQDSLEARQALLAEKLNDLPSIDRRRADDHLGLPCRGLGEGRRGKSCLWDRLAPYRWVPASGSCLGFQTLAIGPFPLQRSPGTIGIAWQEN